MIQLSKKALVYVFVLILFVFFAGLVGGRLFRNQIKMFTAPSTAAIDFVDIDWEKLFPYDTETDKIPSTYTLPEDGKDSLVDKYVNTVGIFEQIGYLLSYSIPFYDELSKTGFVISSRLSDPSITGNYVRTKNGYWYGVTSEQITDNSAKAAILPYVYMKQYLEEKRIAILYCYAPSKDCKFENQFPLGVTTYTNNNIDCYLDALREYDVNSIDLRYNIHTDGLEHESLFYKTDHHWKIEAGLWAADIIGKELKDRFGITIENAFNLGSYSKKTYDNAMLGSYGQAVTRYIAHYEDFSILYPKFETYLELEVPDIGMDRRGSFEELFDNTDYLHDAIEQAEVSMYSSVLYGNRPYEKITNLKNPEGPKVLMIKDSFGIAAAPYLALSCSELVLLDTRPTNGNFTGSVISCINDFEPDVVLVLQNSPQSIVLSK